MLRQFKNTIGKGLLTAFCCWLSLIQVQANSVPVPTHEHIGSTELSAESQVLRDSLITVFNTAEEDSTKSKALAAILAFPVPFGMFGLHRLYLGAKPIIPILYIVTFGGAFGILPFIDMMVVILSRDTKPFYKNSKILMWYKEKKKEKELTTALILQ